MTITYYRLDGGIVVEWNFPTEIPQVLVNGEWQNFINVESLTNNAEVISKEEFDDAVKEQLSTYKKG